MKKIYGCFVFFISIFYFGQIKFEKGYFIDNNGAKNEVLIKNEDWKNNPQSFQYKNNETGEAVTKSISEVIEFGVNNDTKFVRKSVMIDRSSENLKKPFKNKSSRV